MLINWWLIIICVVLALIVIGVTTYIMCIYSSPHDKNQAWVPKIVVVLSFSLACFAVLLLPLDVANRADPDILGLQNAASQAMRAWFG